jgi:hypothetical protein
VVSSVVAHSNFTGYIVIALASAFVLSFSNLAHDGTVGAFSNAIQSYNVTTGEVQLGAPFYEEHYKAKLGIPEAPNSSFTGNFTGQGVLNGNLSVSAEGNATGTIRGNDTIFLQGSAKFVTENDDTALYSFDAFTNYNPDGSSEGIGIAAFDKGATGKLSFLSNTLAVYRNNVNSDGNGTFLMWQWK